MSGKGDSDEKSGGSAARRPIVLAWDQPESNLELRHTGIKLIPRLPWGSHICLFYETKEDLTDTLISYFRSGLDNNEFCLWVVPDLITVESAQDALRRHIEGFDRHAAEGRIELLPSGYWFLTNKAGDIERIAAAWHRKLDDALARGFDGMKGSGNAFWQHTDRWGDFLLYERALEKALAGTRMMVLCTYEMDKSGPQDVLNVARAHQSTVAYRHGEWDFLEVPRAGQAKREIRVLNGDLDALDRPFQGSEALTQRERIVLAQIVKGASSKAAARALGISPRTVDFHRANIMQKLGAKNAADLVRMVLGSA